MPGGCRWFQSRQTDLDDSLGVRAQLAGGQQLGSVRRLVGLQVVAVLPDVGPAPHAVEASDVNLQDAADSVLPPAGGHETNTPKRLRVGLESRC